jgi:hypothetical protein
MALLKQLKLRLTKIPILLGLEIFYDDLFINTNLEAK